MVVKEVKLMAPNKGIRIHPYLDYWLVRATSQRSPAYSDSTGYESVSRLDSKLRKIRTGTQTDIHFHRLPVRLQGGQGQILECL